MAPAAGLLGNRLPFEEAENTFFADFRLYTVEPTNPGLPTAELAKLLDYSALMLEIFAIGACASELVPGDSDADTTQGAPATEEAFFSRIRAQCGINVSRTVAEGLQIFGPPDPGPAQLPPRAEILNIAGAVVAACPVAALEQLAVRLAKEDVGHRIRVAYDALRAFVLRNDPRHQRQLKILGAKYMMGGLTISECAELLGVSLPDVVQFLEDLGFARPLEFVRLEEDEREYLLQKVRDDRSRPHEDSEESIARSVIASERIEGIDARRWMLEGSRS